MNNSKLIILLNKFTKKETNEFLNYLHGFHHKMNKAIAMYGYLKSVYPKFPEKKLSYEVMALELFNKKVISSKDRKNYQNTLSDLYQWAKDFLIWKRLQKDDFKKELDWLDILNERGMHHDFELRVAAIEKGLKKTAIRDNWDFYNRMLFHHKVWSHQMTNRNKAAVKTVKMMATNLERFYLHTQLMYQTEILNRKNMFDELIDLSKLSKLGQQVNDFSEHILSKTIYQTYELVFHKTEEKYEALKKTFLEESQLLSFSVQNSVHMYLINFGIQKSRNGFPRYYREVFDLYKKGLETNLIVVDGAIANHIFQNVVIAALGAEEYEWCEGFINNYNKYLPEPTRYSAICFSMATSAFLQKDHDSEWFVKLQTVPISDVQFGIQVKTLLIRNLYESEQRETFLLLQNSSFVKYIKRNKKLQPSFLQSCLAFSELFKELVLKRITRSEFLKKIDEKQPILYLWLKEKADDLS